MENILPLLQTTSLFTGIEADALRVLLGELGAVIRSYGRGEALVQAGATNRRVGVVLTGHKTFQSDNSCFPIWKHRILPVGLDPGRQYFSVYLQ